jgi:hypothetical protein
VASLNDGEIQVFLDRRLDQDDGLGMSQAMNDNVMVSSRLVLLFEPVNPKISFNSMSSGLPSLFSSWMSNDLLYPLVKLIANFNSGGSALLAQRSFSRLNYPCDLHLLNLRSMQKDANEEPLSGEVGLILHRVNHDDCAAGSFIETLDFLNQYCSAQDASAYKFEDFFDFLGKDNLKKMVVKNTLLTLASNYSFTFSSKSDSIISRVQPMQVEAFRVVF